MFAYVCARWYNSSNAVWLCLQDKSEVCEFCEAIFDDVRRFVTDNRTEVWSVAFGDILRLCEFFRNEKPPLSSTVKSRRLTVWQCGSYGWLGRCKTDTHLEPHWSSREDLLGDRTPLVSEILLMTWPLRTLSYDRQEMRLRINLSGSCWLCIALPTADEIGLICVASTWHNHEVFLQYLYHTWLGYT